MSKNVVYIITTISDVNDVKTRLVEIFDEVHNFLNQTSEKHNSLLIETKANFLYCNPNDQKFIIDKQLLKGTNIKTIASVSTGLNHIDLDYCKKHNIDVISLTKEYNILDTITATAELAFGLMISLIRKIPGANYTSSYGYWSWKPYVGRQLNQLSIGIVGYGRLGKMMAKYCNAFGMEVIVHDPYEHSLPYHEEAIELNDLVGCDIISLHVHVTKETFKMINKNFLRKCTGTYLINTSRGDIVNEEDVIWALENKYLAGYATDVISDELSDDRKKSPIIKAMKKMKTLEWRPGAMTNPDIIVTPHIGGMTKESRYIANHAILNKLVEYIENKDNKQ